MKRIVLGVILAFVFFIMGMGLWKIRPRSLQVIPSEDKKISVVTSFYPLYYFVSEIGGEKIAVKNLISAGVEPHDFEPTARDIALIQQSKLLIINGGSLETWGEKVRSDVEKDGVVVIEAGDNLFENGDPHVWLSLKKAKIMVEKIEIALERIDGENKVYYQTNAQNLLEKLRRLDDKYTEVLKVCETRSFVTAHDAFGYLARDYKLTQVSIAGISPDEEPSTKKLAEITDFVRKNGVKYIYFESLISPKLSETIATETGAKTMVLNPLEGLTSDEINQSKNYITIMEENLNNLKTGLSCQ